MYDYSSHFPASRQAGPYPQYTRRDGAEAARMLQVTALLGIATRLFYIYASANRISVTHTLLGLLNADGQIIPGGQYAAGAGGGLAGQAYDADAMVTIALVASLVVVALFIAALVSLGRRGKRGDALAAAVSSNRAVRLAGLSYLLVAASAIIAGNALRSSPGTSPADRLHTLLAGDTVTIGLQVAVIAILLVITLATAREVRKPL